MKITILTLFPRMFEGFFTSSIMRRAVEKGTVEYRLVDFRLWATDRHRSVDDLPYGGGAGMVLMYDPLARALDELGTAGKRVIYPSPSGVLLDQSLAHELSNERELLFICGHYEGLDQRIIDEYVDDEISIGDYVITGGEVATMVIVDSVFRLIDGVISSGSLDEESFADGLLEYPQYTRSGPSCPKEVPHVLLSGHHGKIESWRLEQKLLRTMERRIDLLETASLDAVSRKKLNELKESMAKGIGENGRDESC
ncbi:MAG: tRNA (guanosine(37)-N1)-methyltransferase TrmD [Spirochaetales bacterium]|nr:tRNA (guanosine(37)-N1)-methyltransferase TrmD [Spirochaetales bacterium]